MSRPEAERCTDSALRRMVNVALEKEAQAEQAAVTSRRVAAELAVILGTSSNREVVQQDSERHKFIQELNKLLEECGLPSYRQLAANSQKVRAHYRKELPQLRELSVTAISDVLAGRRKNPPAWDWVATFVLSCQDYARMNGACLDDPGTATLPGWHARYGAARIAFHRRGLGP
jgi:hypothetical protein